VYLALCLYYSAQDPETPAWARAVAYGALAYLVFPLDAMPDPMYVDDLGVLTAALAVIGVHVSEDAKRRAKEKMTDWFGDDGDAP
jgi:uncharacterized membrane protein YkvA (DUF1232 family)